MFSFCQNFSPAALRLYPFAKTILSVGAGFAKILQKTIVNNLWKNGRILREKLVNYYPQNFSQVWFVSRKLWKVREFSRLFRELFTVKSTRNFRELPQEIRELSTFSTPIMMMNINFYNKKGTE